MVSRQQLARVAYSGGDNIERAPIHISRNLLLEPRDGGSTDLNDAAGVRRK